MTKDDAVKILAQAVFLAEIETLDRATMQDRDKFATLMRHAVTLLRPDDLVEPEEAMTIRVRTRGTPVKSLRIRLDRMYETVRPSDDELTNAVTVLRFVMSVGELVEHSFGVLDIRQPRDLSKTIPLLKPTSFIDHIVQRADRDHKKSGTPLERHLLVHWQAPNGLRAVAAIDTPEKYDFVTEADIAEEGISHDAAVELAIANLRELHRSTQNRSDYSNGLYEFTEIGGAASSLLLLDEFLAEESEKAGEALMFHAFDADHLIAVPFSNSGEIMLILEAIKARAAPSLVGTAPMIYADGVIRDMTIDDVKELVQEEIHDLTRFFASKFGH